MVEESVRQLLHQVAPARLPEPRIDVVAARRAGRRRLRWRRACVSTGSLGIVSAVTAVSLATGTLVLPWGASRGAGPVTSQRHSATPHVPRHFSMLIPYAAFGYLPSGYATDGQSQVTTSTSVQLTAAKPSHGTGQAGQGTMLSLVVNAAGACQLLAKAGTHVASASGCVLGPVLERAPDVRGRPAYWVAFGLIWQYGPGAWATLGANVRFFHPQGLAGLHPAGHQPLSPAQSRKIQRTATRWANTPPSGTPARELLQVADHVRYGQTTPIRFPFRLAGTRFAGWQLTGQVNYQVSGRLLLGSYLSAGPAHDPASAVGISVTPAGAPGNTCKVISGQAQPVAVDGVPAVLRILNEPGKQFESLCIADIQGVSVYLAEDGLQSLTGFFGKVHLLGADPARWTTRPLG